jgi:N-acetylmuramoyl-L-alanine amidase
LAWHLANRKPHSALSTEYVIAKGDTLSAIAKRHSVSLQALLELNRLDGGSIRVGQTLKIPAS